MARVSPFVVRHSLAALFACVTFLFPLPSAISVDFQFKWDGENAGAFPAGWVLHTTGRGTPGDWRIADDGGKKVLGQLATGGFGYLMRCFVWESRAFQDVKLSLKVKAVS